MNASHAEDCVGYLTDEDDEQECEAIYGEWDQPPGEWVGEAEALLGADARWCQIRLLAHTLWEKNDG